MQRPYDDIREWLELVESMGELKRVNGAYWNLEIGALAELIQWERTGTIRHCSSIASQVIPKVSHSLRSAHFLSPARVMAGLPMDSVRLKQQSRSVFMGIPKHETGGK